MTTRRPAADPPPIENVNEDVARRTAAHYAPIWNLPIHVVTITDEKAGKRLWFWTSIDRDRCWRNGWTIEDTITAPASAASSEASS